MKLITLSILFVLVSCGSEPKKEKVTKTSDQKIFSALQDSGEDSENITWVWDSTKKVQLGYQMSPLEFQKGKNSTNILKIRLKKDDKSIDMETTETTKVQPKMTCCGYQPDQDLAFDESVETTSVQSLYFHMEGNWDIFVHVQHGDETYKFTINTEVK